ncbi:Ig-like domain-containing protein [Pseudomonas sp. LB3P93]
MLVQPTRQPVSLLLRPPEIPGAHKLESSADVWGINRAAALDNFPDNGLKVYVPAWSAMGKGDKAELLFNGLVVDQHTLTADTEVGERVTLWVAPKHWLTGPHTLAYRVTRFNQGPETYAPPLKLYAKLEIPAGQDTDEAEGSHSNLYMFIDPAIVEGIVDKDIAEDGVPILVRAEAGTGAPYPDAAEGDVIVCSWGGVYVESAPLTAEQISDPVSHPTEILFHKAIILEAGDTDGDGLAVTFRVRDVVHNYSEDWCKATRLVVMTGTDLLDAPIAKEAVNNVLDLDTLGEKNLTVQVWAKKPAFQLGDHIVVKMRGTTVEGEAVEITTPPQTVDNLPHTYEVSLSNADVRQLAKTQVTFSCHVERPGIPEPLPSKGQFVSFIGEPKRLAAPSAEAEQNGAIDPNLLSPRVRIPFDLIMLLGMGIELIWSGMRPDKSSYTPELEWHILSKEEIEAGKDLFITVDGKHLKTLEGGTLDLSYYLLSEGPNGEIVRRESLHATQLKVGEPQFELVKPIVLGEQEGALEPNDWPNGVGWLTAPRPTVNPTQAGDKVFYKWVGEATGIKEDDILLNALTKDKDVRFTLSAAFVAEHIGPNRGKQVTVSYRIWRAATDETSYSNGLEFVVGQALELILDPSAMVLDGFNISIAGTGLDWVLTGNDPDGTADTRVPTGGNPPFTYRSSHPNIASVDSNGRVRSEGNGSATIYVSDQHQTKSYQVTTSNVITYLYNPTGMHHRAYLDWVTRVSGSFLDHSKIQTHIHALNAKYHPKIQQLYRTTNQRSPDSPYPYPYGLFGNSPGNTFHEVSGLYEESVGYANLCIALTAP